MTAQAADIIYIKGVKNLLYSNPLESYWNEDNPRPKFGLPPVSVLFRGYLATWEIIDNYLYLIDIYYFTRFGKFGFENMFPDRGDKLKAVWFTGQLKVPQGEMLKYIHMGYGSLYERFLYLDFKDGALVNERLEETDRSKLEDIKFKSLLDQG